MKESEVVMSKLVHLAVYDTLADWEVGYAVANINTPAWHDGGYEVVTVAETLEPVTTMGGLTIQPAQALAELDPSVSQMLILPGPAPGTRAATGRSRPWRGGSWTRACPWRRSAGARSAWPPRVFSTCAHTPRRRPSTSQPAATPGRPAIATIRRSFRATGSPP